ncbi:MAG: ABC transporter ATP-binding protein [Armatimonadetes bacterium]|nr:ABC transporter ATP-binding protein [Armatimonadota bacterium]
MLALRSVSVRYGAIEALSQVDLEVNQGEIVTLIGANGAGKSTTIRAICGQVPTSSGSIHFEGREITRTPAHRLVHAGIAQSPEGRRIFANMTVRENLELGAFIHHGKHEQIRQDIDRVFQLFPRLSERVNQSAGTLSGGEQQMLAMGRSLMARPKLLLRDEPSLGLAPFLVQQIFQIIREINKEGVTILLVEQNAYQALRVAHRAYVLGTGSIVVSDTAERLLANEQVQAAYLGE